MFSWLYFFTVFKIKEKEKRGNPELGQDRFFRMNDLLSQLIIFFLLQGSDYILNSDEG